MLTKRGEPPPVTSCICITHKSVFNERQNTNTSLTFIENRMSNTFFVHTVLVSLYFQILLTDTVQLFYIRTVLKYFKKCCETITEKNRIWTSITQKLKAERMNNNKIRIHFIMAQYQKMFQRECLIEWSSSNSAGGVYCKREK